MNTHQLAFGKDAQLKLAAGADKLAKAVVSTLGPRSHNVAINREYPAPIVLHDGVSVAQSIRLKDPFEDMGAVLLREAASKTNGLAGDGTTTATLLANTLIQEGIKLFSGVGEQGFIVGNINPMFLQEELKKYSDLIVQKLVEHTRKFEGRKQYEQIACISSASKHIGKLVADAIEKVGAEGIVMVEESTSYEDSLEFQEGMEFENGYLSPLFITNPERATVEYKDAYLLMTDSRISDAADLVPIIEKVNKAGGKPLVIIADDVTGPALRGLIITKLNNSQRNVAIVAPEFGERRKEMLQDIAILTGGNVISYELNQNISKAEIKDLGKLKSIVVSATHTTITPENPDSEEIQERVTQIREQIKEEKNEFKKSRLEDRLGKLTSGVAVINVGGASQTEIQDRRERVIDAVHATKGAISDGIVAGAGMTLLNIAEELATAAPEEEKKSASFGLIQKMLRAPFEKILSNAGFDPKEIEQQITSVDAPKKDDVVGFDVTDGTVKPLIESGIVDPVRVTKYAVIHAISVASMILTTDTLVAEEKSDVQKMELVNR